MNQPGTMETGRKDRIVGLYSQARQLAIGRDYAQALELYDKIIADVPRIIFETPRINYERALCLKALGRIEQAEQAIRSCLSVRNDDPEFLRFLSEIQPQNKKADVRRGPEVEPPPKEEKAEEAERLYAEVRTTLPLVEKIDVERALRAISLIEEQMIGRWCGELGDKLLQYLSIVQFAQATGSKTVDSIEIGTLFGGSCLAKLFAMRDLGVQGKIVCIDPMMGYYDQQLDPHAGLPVTAEVFFRNIDNFGFSRESIDLRQVKSEDPRALEGLREKSFATLLVDGDHCSQGVRGDWENYNKFVSDDGIVLFDDYTNWRWPDIGVFVNELKDSLPGGWKEMGCLGTTLLLGRVDGEVGKHRQESSFIQEQTKMQSGVSLTRDALKVNQGLDESSAMSPRAEDTYPGQCWLTFESQAEAGNTGLAKDKPKSQVISEVMPVVDLPHFGVSVSFERRTSQALELCRHGLALAKSGEHTAALAFLDQVLIEYPDVAPKMMGLQLHRGSCLRAVRRFGEAAQAIRNELSLDPNNSRCRKLLNDIQRENECGDLVRDEYNFASVAASSMRCELCNSQCLVFEKQFERNWHICPNCNLIRSDVDESQAKVLDKGSPAGSKSPTYGVIHRREEFFCRVFLEQLKLNDILLYGIGWSPVYKNFKEAGYNVVGCDLWRPLIEERNKQFGQGAFYHRDDLPDLKFDVISAFEVFEHFVRPVQEVQLLANHLKNNGIIVGCTDFWHGGSLSKHPNPDRSYWVHKSHVTTWTWKSMNAVAHQFGLKTYYCKTNKRNFAAKVFFVMYKGSKYDQFVQELPKIFYDVW